MGVYLRQIAITTFLIIVSIVKINFAQILSDGNILAKINGDSDALPSLSNYITQDDDHLAAGNIVASINGLSNVTRITSQVGSGEQSHRPLTHTAGTGNVVAAINGKTRPPKNSLANSKQVNNQRSLTPSRHGLKNEKPNRPKHHHAMKKKREAGKKHAAKAKHKRKNGGHNNRGKFILV